MKYVIDCTGSMCKLSPALPDHINQALHHECSFEVDGSDNMPVVRRGHWDGRRRLYHKSYRTFPQGLVGRVVKFLAYHKIEVEIRHSFQSYPIAALPMARQYELRPYQEQVTESAIRAERCMIRVATGGGKTVIAGKLMSRLQERTLFLVHTKGLLWQAYRAFVDMFGKERVGMIGDGFCSYNDVTVATIQTISRALGIEYEHYDMSEDEPWNDDEAMAHANPKEYIGTFLRNVGIVFMDECHRVAAPTAMAVMGAISSARWRFGLSASPWRDDGADLALEGAFGGVACDVTASDLIDQGFLVRPVIRFLDVPSMRFPKGARYDTVYKQYIVNNQERNDIGVRAAASMVLRGRPTMILVRHVRHGVTVARQLQDRLGVTVPFLSGSDSSFTRERVLNDMRNGVLPALVATTIADEGLDIRPLSGLVLLGGGKSSVRALQRIGRALRTYPGKESAEIVDFMDSAKYLAQHSGSRHNIYQTEPGWIITDV